jgi:SAM-dependent methyltransferase
MAYVAAMIPNPTGSVLEVGSYDENGTVRPLFGGCEFVGVDMREGPGVDRVASSHDLPFDDGQFDVVVSTEMLEHDPYPWVSMAEMGRVLVPGGLLVVTARGNGFKLHAYPDDYWRFMPSSFPVLLSLAGCDVVDVREDPQAPGMFGCGRKRG